MQVNTDHQPYSFRESTRRLVKWLANMPSITRIMLMTIAFGMLTHGFVYCNTLIGHDNIKLFSAYVISPPRWSTQLFYFYRAYLQLPWVIGAVTLLELGMINVLLARLFSIKRLMLQFLLVITVVTFPSVISFHNFGAVDLFTGSLLFSVLAVYLFQKSGLWSFLGSIVCLIISIASYQAFVCTASVLMLLVLLNRLIIGPTSVKAVLLSCLKAFVIIVFSIIVYYITFRLLVSATDYTVTTYRNQNEMGVFSVGQLLQWVKASYKTVLRYYISAGLNPLPIWISVLQLFAVALITVFLFVRLIKLGFTKQPSRIILTILLVALLPLAMNAIQVFNSGLEPHLLMTFAFIAPWLFVLQYGEWLLDEHPASQSRSSAVPKIASMVCALMICMNAFYGYILANADYVCRKMNYDASLSLATRLVSRIESVPGYRLDTPVIFVGSLFAPYYASQRKGFEMANAVVGSTSNSGQAMTYNDEYGSTIQWFIRTALSSNMVFVPDGDIDIYRNNQDVIAMNAYPASDCCLWVGDVLVMKLSD